MDLPVSFADGQAILLVLKKYLEKYQTANDMPLVRFFSRTEELRDLPPLDYSFQDYLKVDPSNEHYPLTQIFLHYSKLFEVDQPDLSKQKHNITTKDKQVNHILAIVDLINESEQKKIEDVYEMCCGRSVLGHAIWSKLSIFLHGFDINQNLLDDDKILCPNRSEFVQMDLLKQMPSFCKEPTTGQNCLVTSLHACGKLHRNIIDGLIEQKYEGKFIIIPCCYHKHVSTFEPYKLYSYDEKVPIDLLGAAARGISASYLSMNFSSKHIRKMYFIIKVNLLFRYLIENKLITNYESSEINYLVTDNFMRITKLNVEKTEVGKEEEFWSFIFHKFNLTDQDITYQKYKDIIFEQDALAQKIVTNVYTEKFFVISLVSRLIEILMLIDYTIHLQKHLKQKITLRPFCSSQVSPRNVMICGS